MSNMFQPGEDLKPNATMIPNIILDVLMPQLSGSEEKIIRVICRQTYGWHKTSDKISNSQMIEKAGIEEATLKRSMKSLADRNIINRHIGNGRTMTEYSLNYDSSQWRGINLSPPQKEPSEGVKIVPPEGVKMIHNKRNYQKKLSKENTIEAEASPSLYKKTVELIGKAHKHLTKDELVWKGMEGRYGKATKQILEIVSHETPEAAFTQIREKCAAYVAAAQTDKYLKTQGVTPVSILASWNKVHYKPNMLKGAFGTAQKDFPKYQDMTPEQIQTAFTKWNKHFTVLDVKANVSPESYERFVREAGGYAPALVDILIEEVHSQKKTA